MNPFVIIILFSSFFLFSCEKIIPDLPKKNQNDSAYTGNDVDKIRKLTFDSYSIVCRRLSSGLYAQPNKLQPGDEVWVQLKMNNISNHDINVIRGAITTQSSYAQIKPLTGGNILKFTNKWDRKIDKIAANSLGEGSIDNGTFFYMNTPSTSYNNSEVYSFQFTLSSNAVVGQQIIFMISTTDNANNKWNENFSIIVQ